MFSFHENIDAHAQKSQRSHFDVSHRSKNRSAMPRPVVLATHQCVKNIIVWSKAELLKTAQKNRQIKVIFDDFIQISIYPRQ